MIALDSIPLCVAIYELDDDGDFIFKEFNKRAQEIDNIQKEVIIGKKVIEIFSGVESMGLLDIFKRVYETGEEETLEIGLYEDNHISGWRKNIVSKLENNTIMAIYEDISEENKFVAEFEALLHKKTKELEEFTSLLEEKVISEVAKNAYQQKQLFAKSRLAQLGEMISMIAHQWRQPLGAISSTSTNLLLRLELESYDLSTQQEQDTCRQYFIKRLNNINSFVNTLTTTIDDFRSFYKPSNTITVDKLDSVLSKTLNIIQNSLENDNIEIRYHAKETEKFKMYDNELMQVILNILKNSQDNFKDKKIKNPLITIRIEDKNIQICDNGEGIDKKIIDNIFDPYFSTKEEKNGTGLGLYMSKTIVEEHHNGKLSVHNTKDGVCFKIDIANGGIS